MELAEKSPVRMCVCVCGGGGVRVCMRVGGGGMRVNLQTDTIVDMNILFFTLHEHSCRQVSTFGELMEQKAGAKTSG